jgi:SAM-dependent methyltransferase
MELNMAVTVQEIEARFENAHPGFKTDIKDLERIETAANFVVGKTVLDIGSGPGILLHLLAEQGQYSRITSFDISNHSKQIRHPNVQYNLGDLRSRDCLLPAHETVLCMEVLEHCEAHFNQQMLRNVRDAALQRAIYTVPYNEPEPLWWHDKPGGHRQRFTLTKMAEMFPTAFATIVPRYGVDWALIVEDNRQKANYFQLVARDRLKKILTM